MPLVRLAPPFDAFHGTVTGQSGDYKLVIFGTSKAGGVARQWVSPTNPQTTNQMLLRSYQIASTAAYKLLDKAEADDWNEAAADINRTNILNLSYTLSGINLFVMINVYRQIRAQAILEIVPAIVKPPIPTAVTSVTLSATPSLVIVAQVPGLADADFAMVRASVALPSEARKARTNEMRLVGTPISTSIIHPSSGVVTFTRILTAGQYTVGDRIGVEVTPLSVNNFPGDKFLEPNIGVQAP